jgi:7-cyano-7-deazaguanine synthase in queuosine biosynthesis
MKSPRELIIVACNDPPIDISKVNLVLDYQNDSPGRKLCLSLPPFVQNVYHLPHRILDLLELAAYIYAVDRYSPRGSRTDLEYHGWTRSFQIHCKVRDYKFWAQDHIKKAFVQALRFMSGDRSYDLIFYEGHATPPTSLFDRREFQLNPGKIPVAVLPFSGGLDSLAGAHAILSKTHLKVCLVSHQAQPGSKKTQDSLAAALSERFPRRVAHYRFSCHLKKIHASEETQRVRSFLFSSIAFAIATAYGQNTIHVYENGITSMNFPRRQDQINARASRTTHPQTMNLLSSFFSLVSDASFMILIPFLFKTKKDIFLEIRNGPHSDLIPSTVSCSSTYTYPRQATHCGVCLQCVDRRIAAFSAGLTTMIIQGFMLRTSFQILLIIRKA